ncbi:MAG: hypothetical protein KGJ59_10545 [Bacteroidota bacterium]|nr:hypothetical protein [Bacteroidota bacterium]
MKSLPNIIVLLFCLHGMTFAQSAFLEDNQSATAVSAGSALNKDAFSAGGTIAFSIKGRVDLRLTIGETFYSGINYSRTAFAPTFEFQIMKSTPDHPVAIAAGFSAEVATYSDDYNSQNEISTADLSFFGNIYHNFSLGKGIVVQPAYELHYTRGLAQAQDVSGNYRLSYSGVAYESASQTTETDVESWLHSIGLTFSFTTSPSTQLLVSPSVAMTSTITTWGAEVGIIF